MILFNISSVRSAKEAGAKVVDVDGSYVHRKQSTSTSGFDPDQIPAVPLIGWESVDSATSINAQNLPKVTHGKLVPITTCTVCYMSKFLF